MNQITGREILRQVQQRCKPLRSNFLDKKVTIIRFRPPEDEVTPLELAKYEAARYSTNSKVKTFEFIGCKVEQPLLPYEIDPDNFEEILLAACANTLTVGVIVQNPIPPRFQRSFFLLRPELDLDGLSENHPLFVASATSEAIARLVTSFTQSNSLVAVVGGRGFVGNGVVQLLAQQGINCLPLDMGDDLLREVSYSYVGYKL